MAEAQMALCVSVWPIVIFGEISNSRILGLS